MFSFEDVLIEKPDLNRNVRRRMVVIGFQLKIQVGIGCCGQK